MNFQSLNHCAKTALAMEKKERWVAGCDFVHHGGYHVSVTPNGLDRPARAACDSACLNALTLNNKLFYLSYMYFSSDFIKIYTIKLGDRSVRAANQKVRDSCRAGGGPGTNRLQRPKRGPGIELANL